MVTIAAIKLETVMNVYDRHDPLYGAEIVEGKAFEFYTTTNILRLYYGSVIARLKTTVSMR